MACGWDIHRNLETAQSLVREAADQGARFILMQELFETPCFRIEQHLAHPDLTSTISRSRPVQCMQQLAHDLGVVLPVSFFERIGTVTFNPVAMIDADGPILGKSRESHIPNVLLYREKGYFSRGDTGFRVGDARHAGIGIGICWDQWFPEAA